MELPCMQVRRPYTHDAAVLQRCGHGRRARGCAQPAHVRALPHLRCPRSEPANAHVWYGFPVSLPPDPCHGSLRRHARTSEGLSRALACRSYPEAPLCAVGFSLGALILTKYLAEAAALRSKALDLSAARLDEREAEEQRCNGNAERSDSAEADGFGGSSPQPASANGEAAAAEAPSRFENGSDASGRGGANGAAALPAHGSDANGHRSTNGAAAPPADGLTAAAVVANPFDMAVAAKNVSRPWTLGWIYNFVLTFRRAPAPALDAPPPVFTKCSLSHV